MPKLEKARDEDFHGDNALRWNWIAARIASSWSQATTRFVHKRARTLAGPREDYGGAHHMDCHESRPLSRGL